MKFTKGLLIGGLISAGILMMYSEGMMNKNRMKRTGKKLAKKMKMM